jgi:histidine phosphotransferase ChpT
METLPFASLLTSKICHDLVSPASSIVTAFDFLTNDSDAATRATAMALLQSGVSELESKLLVLRYAMGPGGSRDSGTDVNEFRKLTEHCAHSVKPDVKFTTPIPEITRPQARLLLNVVMIALSALPRGGEVAISFQQSATELKVEFGCSGDRPKLRPETLSGLAGREPEDGWNARNIQPLFTRIAADEIGARLSHRGEGDDLTLVVSFPV